MKKILSAISKSSVKDIHDMPGRYIEEIPGANPNDFHVFEQHSQKSSQSGGQFYCQSTPIL